MSIDYKHHANVERVNVWTEVVGDGTALADSFDDTISLTENESRNFSILLV